MSFRQALGVVYLLALTTLTAQTPPAYDLLIKNGRILDGAGNPWFTGDIAIRGDSIAYVGPKAPGTAKTEIDAHGLTIAPGFIDTHSHSRGAINREPLAENLLRQGVTTLIEGPDGSSPLPLGAYLEKVAALPLGVNFGSMVGQGSIRTSVIGTKDRKATAEELDRMKGMVRQSMLEGAFGMSTGLFYVPGNFTPTEEVVALAHEAGLLGGIHTSHMRDEADHVIDAVKETIRIGEEGGLPTQVTHHKIIGTKNWGASLQTIKLVEEARARGVDVTVDQYPYTASSTGLAALFPQWALESGAQAIHERLQAPEQRARIKTEVVRKIVEDRGGGDPKNVSIASCGFDPSLSGKNLAEITAARGLAVTNENAAEVAMDLVDKGGCSAIFHAINEQDIERIMRYPFTMIASDGGVQQITSKDVPHPRNYGTFARVLGRYVRDRKVITLEDAIRRMTSLPAMRFRITDRGLLRPGMKADVVVFDPATVADKSEFGKPHQYSVGFSHVVVNGVLEIRDGATTGSHGGRVIYGPAKKVN